MPFSIKKLNLLITRSLICIICSSGCLFGKQKKDIVFKPLYVTDSMIAEARYVVNAREKAHFNKEPLENLDGKKLITNYLNSLDTNRLFFMQAEVDDFLRKYSRTTKYFLKRGRFEPALEIFKVYRENVKNRIFWIFKRLEGDFSFNEKSSYIPVRKELPWPQSIKDSNKLWESRLKYELLNEILSEINKQNGTNQEKIKENELNESAISKEILEKATQRVVKRYEMVLDYIADIEPSEVQEIFLTDYMQMDDPHSMFMSKDTLDQFSISLHNSLVGIGAELSMEEGICTIKGLLPGAPAEKSNQLQPNDQILAVGQGEEGEMQDVVGLKLIKITNLIRGKKGTVVRLLIRPAGKDPSARKTVTIVRDAIRLTANLAEARLYEIPNQDEVFKIGVIDIPAFYGPQGDKKDEQVSTTHNVKELIEKLQNLGSQGIILDLRRNGGGLLIEAISLTGLFIPIGPVVNVKDARGNIREYLDTDPSIAWRGPLIVLVSRYSASASEIFAGALKSHHRAIIVGDSSTHGKGTVQVFSEIPPPLFYKLLGTKKHKLGATTLTIQKWYLPDGNSTQLKGVPSNIVLPSINEILPIGESDLPNALPWDSIQILPWSHENLSNYTDTIAQEDIDFLNQLSLARQGTLEEFQFLKTTIERFQKKQNQKEFSLNFLERQKESNEDKIFKEKMKQWLRTLSKTNDYSFKTIFLDIVPQENKNKLQQALDSLDLEDNSLKENENEEKLPNFDIHMRESLRIMADYLHIKKSSTNDNRQIAHNPYLKVSNK